MHASVAGAGHTGSPVGTVRFFDAKKGYGFLSRPDGASDVFVHASNIQGHRTRGAPTGQQVRFEITTGRRATRPATSSSSERDPAQHQT